MIDAPAGSQREAIDADPSQAEAAHEDADLRSLHGAAAFSALTRR